MLNYKNIFFTNVCLHLEGNKQKPIDVQRWREEQSEKDGDIERGGGNIVVSRRQSSQLSERKGTIKSTC